MLLLDVFTRLSFFLSFQEVFPLPARNPLCVCCCLHLGKQTRTHNLTRVRCTGGRGWLRCGANLFQMYFNTVLTDSAKLLKPLLVFTFAMLAILAGLTRIIQFRNHPVDVYCGWILGAAVAIYLVRARKSTPGSNPSLETSPA